tara:strand:- start:830 stop:1594 length:765 start_codon:yes stop_codon:yes gene_type:complete
MTTKVGVFGGNIGVGTNDPGNYDLDVVGSLRVNTVDFGDAANAHIPSGFIMIWKGFQSNIPTGWVICDGANGTPNLTDKFIRGASGDVASPTIATGINTQGGSDNTTLTEPMLAPHSHTITVETGSAAHNHNVSNSGAQHGHNANNSGSHDHYLDRINWRQNPGWINMNVGGGGGQYAIHSANHLSDGAMGYNNNHSHQWQQSRYGNVNGAPHSHQGNYANAPHGHQASSGNTGTGAAIPVTNPYYALYYMMKT